MASVVNVAAAAAAAMRTSMVRHMTTRMVAAAAAVSRPYHVGSILAATVPSVRAAAGATNSGGYPRALLPVLSARSMVSLTAGIGSKSGAGWGRILAAWRPTGTPSAATVPAGNCRGGGGVGTRGVTTNDNRTGGSAAVIAAALLAAIGLVAADDSTANTMEAAGRRCGTVTRRAAAVQPVAASSSSSAAAGAAPKAGCKRGRGDTDSGGDVAAAAVGIRAGRVTRGSDRGDAAAVGTGAAVVHKPADCGGGGGGGAAAAAAGSRGHAGGSSGGGGGDAARNPEHEAIYRVLEKHFDIHRRRDAELPGGGTPGIVPYVCSEVGSTFPFMNRDDACKAVLVAFDNLWMQQQKAKMMPTEDVDDEVFKVMRPTLPYCPGMPSIGKTRFVREATSHLMRQQLAAGKNEADAARAVVDSITWDDNRRAGWSTPDPAADAEQRRTLVTELWRASNEHRSVLLNCDSYPFQKDSSAREYLNVGAALLTAWACDTFHRRAAAADKRACLLFKDVYSAFTRLPLGTRVTVDDALEVICDGEDKAVFIAVDAAHKSSNLQALLQELYEPLLGHGQQVYVLVSVRLVGRRDKFEEELQRYFGITHIRLPLLTIGHMQAIMRHVLATPPAEATGGAGGGALRADAADTTVDALARSTKLTVALWWLGGTPGVLSQFVVTAAEAAGKAAGGAVGKWGNRECTWAELRRYLTSASMPAIMGIVATVAEKVYTGKMFHFHNASLAAMLSLAVSERPVTRDQKVGSSFKVADGETQRFLHWQELERNGEPAGIVRITPLLLLAGRSPHEVLGDVMKGDERSHSADVSYRYSKQALVGAALLHKYRAAHLCGATAMSLSELGFPAAADVDIGRKRVQVSASEPGLGRDGAAAPSPGDNIVACLLFNRTVPAWTICSPTSAAAAADTVRGGHMRATIHVQDDSTPAAGAGAGRLTRAAAAAAAAAAHALTTDVTAEYHKVAPVLAADAERGVPSLFLFVANQLPPPTSLPAELRGAHVVAAPRMMGALLNTLRAFTPLWPALMDTTPAALEAANRPASAELVDVAGSMWQRPAA